MKHDYVSVISLERLAWTRSACPRSATKAARFSSAGYSDVKVQCGNGFSTVTDCGEVPEDNTGTHKRGQLAKVYIPVDKLTDLQTKSSTLSTAPPVIAWPQKFQTFWLHDVQGRARPSLRAQSFKFRFQFYEAGLILLEITPSPGTIWRCKSVNDDTQQGSHPTRARVLLPKEPFANASQRELITTVTSGFRFSFLQLANDFLCQFLNVQSLQGWEGPLHALQKLLMFVKKSTSAC